MEGMHLLAGIRRCPGTNGSHVLICPLHFRGKKTVVEGDALQGEGCRTSCLSFSQLPLVSRFQQWHLALSVAARNVPNAGGGVTGGRGGKPSLQAGNKLHRRTDVVCLDTLFPEKGFFHPVLLTSHGFSLMARFEFPLLVSNQMAFHSQQVAETETREPSEPEAPTLGLVRCLSVSENAALLVQGMPGVYFSSRARMGRVRMERRMGNSTAKIPAATIAQGDVTRDSFPWSFSIPLLCPHEF